MMTTRQLINQVGNYPDTRVRYPADARIGGIWKIESVDAKAMTVALVPVGTDTRRIVEVDDLDLPMWETM